MSDHAGHPVDYLPELAMGVLPPAEAERIAAVVAQCADCREELNTLSRAIGLLPAVVEEETPSPELRAALLGQIAQERTAAPIDLAERRRQRSVYAFAAAAAAVLALIAGGFAGYVLRGGGTEPEREQAVVEAAARGELLVASFRDATLATTLVRAPGRSEAFVWVENLPALPEGKAYQAWFTRDFEEFEPSDVFTVGDGGAWLAARDSIDGYLAMGLTIEDRDGADEPTMAPFVVIELQRSARTRELPPAIAAATGR